MISKQPLTIENIGADDRASHRNAPAMLDGPVEQPL